MLYKFFLSSTAVLCLLQASMASSPPRQVAILLDVDNTIYNEVQFRIESQIVKNTHSYCKQKFGMEKEEADRLFRQFGSTVEGLKQTLWKGYPESEVHGALDEFYSMVYREIDYSHLLLDSSTMPESPTGYSMTRDRNVLHQMLRFCPHPIYIASNSPSWHVRSTLEAMGFGDIHFEHLFTPDREPFYPTKNDPKVCTRIIRKLIQLTSSPPYNPKLFFGEICEELLSYDRLLVFDDSELNLSRICENFPRAKGILVSNQNPLLTALLQIGLLDSTFEFDQVQYLDSKNAVDRKSMNFNVWNEVVTSLQALEKREIHIADVGAGILSMLDLFLHGDVNEGLRPLLVGTNGPTYIQYTAYESNTNLYAACHRKLLSWGFVVREKVGNSEIVYEGPVARVRLILQDFDTLEPNEPPDLIVGCCFADLFDPCRLVPSLIRSFGLLTSSKTILYFPITFQGITQLLPPRPFEVNSDGMVPSDTVALGLYSNALSGLGHNLDPKLLQHEMERHGFALRSSGVSDWNIDHDENAYLYLCMLYFFGSTGGPKIQQNRWDGKGWIQRIRKNKPEIQVSNVDLVFQIGQKPEQCPRNIDADLVAEEIYFVAPRDVTTRKQRIPKLLPRQVLIKSSHSLISSGTELKIFNGNFEDAALDSTIEDMKEERMAYPLSYGYCLVGRVIQCGDAVPNDLIGKVVFSFSPHGSHVVADVENIQIIPDNIAPEDAIFMPSVETALSLIHDANPRMGENVAVFGQGLIGLLVTAILGLRRQTVCSAKFSAITAFDTIPNRLMAAARFGATQALLPGDIGGPFDISIEVSGNPRALQSAIDLTIDGGRIIVGSWYGKKSAVNLNLGIDFHRSQKTIRASQVSRLPSELLNRWDKERRFEFTWELVRNLKPSRMLSKVTDIKDAKNAYEELDKGQEIAIAFKY